MLHTFRLQIKIVWLLERNKILRNYLELYPKFKSFKIFYFNGFIYRVFTSTVTFTISTWLNGLQLVRFYAQRVTRAHERVRKRTNCLRRQIFNLLPRRAEPTSTHTRTHSPTQGCKQDGGQVGSTCAKEINKNSSVRLVFFYFVHFLSLISCPLNVFSESNFKLKSLIGLSDSSKEQFFNWVAIAGSWEIIYSMTRLENIN